MISKDYMTHCVYIYIYICLLGIVQSVHSSHVRGLERRKHNHVLALIGWMGKYSAPIG